MLHYFSSSQRLSDNAKSPGDVSSLTYYQSCIPCQNDLITIYIGNTKHQSHLLITCYQINIKLFDHIFKVFKILTEI